MTVTASIAPPMPALAAEPHDKTPLQWIDLAVAAVFVVIAAVASGMPNGAARAALTLPMIIFIPGYLMVQAIVGNARPTAFQALIAVGLSPPLVGCLALMTAIVPGGFTAGPIITIVTVASLAMAAVAFVRRLRSVSRPTVVAQPA